MFSSWRRLRRAFVVAAPSPQAEKPRVDLESTELLARVAHEARQPLSAARYAFQIVRSCPDGERRQRASAVLDRQFVRLARLVDDLLDASSLRLGKTTLHVERLDLRGIVEDVAESIRPQVAEKQQRFDTHLPENPVWVDADSARLEQVVSNLLVNGVRYTDPGGRLWLDVAKGPTDAVLTVGDTGRGIAADLLPHIFEPYTTGDAGSGHGLGVGLAIALQLVELHGGTIRASSAGLGSGSEFVVTLPTCHVG
jgi:signal transduction histidine kinase